MDLAMMQRKNERFIQQYSSYKYAALPTTHHPV
jgi:hypothetical protein